MALNQINGQIDESQAPSGAAGRGRDDRGDRRDGGHRDQRGSGRRLDADVMGRILVVALALTLAACGGEDGQDRDASAQTDALAADSLVELPLTRPDRRTDPGWRIEAGEDAYEGDLSIANVAGDTIIIQLVNQDAVNLGIELSGPAGGRVVGDAFLGVGRGPSCHFVVSEPPFGAELEEGEEGWLSGEFSGVLACPDSTALPVRGAFRIPAPDR